jgi:hypothetical protein
VRTYELEVRIDGERTALWFAANLPELLDHQLQTSVEIGGVPTGSMSAIALITTARNA